MGPGNEAKYLCMLHHGFKHCVFVYFSTASKTSTSETKTNQLKLNDMGVLKRLLHPVSPSWVAIADQLGMGSHVPAIRATPSNTNPSEFLRDLLSRWIDQGRSTLEILCRGLRDDPEIIGGAEVANKLEKEFSNQGGV